MLIPIRHENMSARRWPLVTFALIAVNLIVFLATFQSLEGDTKQLGELRLHIVLLAATHPELNTSPEVEEIVRSVKEQYPKDWAELANPQRRAVDQWDRQMLQNDDEDSLQSEMNSLSVQLQQARENSIAGKYAFIPAHPSAISYITANFLHGGWMHLIGNMWFLWLAGFVLEDFWGRWLYSAFYLIAGAAAMQFDAWLNAGSIVPTLGASGAVAALMGAFLVRFPKMKIEMLWWIFLRPRRFKAAAYWLLPAWLAMEIFYGSVFGQSTGVAHWAHVGGFVFGALAALGLRLSGLEQKANQKIEAELTLQSDAEIQKASELIDKGELASAEEILNDYVSRNPNSVDGCNLLGIVYRKKNDPVAAAEILARLCVIHLKAGENELAWKCYEEFLQAGGEAPPAATWLDLCRTAEKLEYFDRALSEYENLASTYPTERQSILAQLAAARLCLKRLNQPERALRLFEAAEKSTVPHLDWEQSIAAGIREAKAAMSQRAAAARLVSSHCPLFRHHRTPIGAQRKNPSTALILRATLARPVSPMAAPTNAIGLSQKPIPAKTSFELARFDRNEVCATINKALQNRTFTAPTTRPISKADWRHFGKVLWLESRSQKYQAAATAAAQASNQSRVIREASLFWVAADLKESH